MRFRGSRRLLVGLGVFLLLLLPACDSSGGSDGQGGPGTPEAITRVVVLLADAQGVNTVTASATDDDADGEFQVQTLRIVQGVTYNGAVELYGPDGEELTPEIVEEGTAHQFFFMLKDGFADFDAQLVVTDADAEGQPIGQRFRLTMIFEEAGMGVFNVVLRHYADGAKTATGGVTDVDVDFPLEVILP